MGGSTILSMQELKDAEECPMAAAAEVTKDVKLTRSPEGCSRRLRIHSSS